MLIFSSVIEILLAIGVALLFILAIKFTGFYEEKRKNKLLVELLACIQKHFDPQEVGRLLEIIENESSLINYVYDERGNTPFLKACELGATKIVKEMINYGADIHYKNFEGNGAIYFATYYLVKHPYSKNASCIRTLYYSGADVNTKNNKGYTPLHLAAYHGHIPLIRWLLEKGADSDVDPLPAGLALANGNKSAACLLIKGQKLFFEKENIFQRLELLNCIKNFNDENCYKKFLNVIKLNPIIICKPYGPYKNTPFLKACMYGATKCIVEMIKIGVDVSYTNAEGNGPLYLAVYNLVNDRTKNDVNCLEALCNAGCEINVKNKKGYTPLHLAGYFGHIPLITYLLKKGANSNIYPYAATLAMTNGHHSAACMLTTEACKSKK